MKKGLIFFGILIFVFLSLSLVHAQEDSTSETQKIEEAYQCLEDKVVDNCATLATEEKIFSLLAINQCRSELISDAINGECWASQGSSCKLKTTSQAILALSDTGSSTTDARTWLRSQNSTSADLDWYLQIETPRASSCTLKYSSSKYNLNINDDKTLSGTPGPYLSISEGDYWLKISPTIYNSEIEISCDKDFMTSLLFKKHLSSTVHVFPESSSASAEGTTKETVESLCFSENNICNYEGSLWAAYVLNSFNEDVSSYLPYLITLEEDNERFLPDSFLYSILQSKDYRTSLLSKQIGDKWWATSGNRYYDTSVALMPFQQETLDEKTNAKQWLLDEQGQDGCWDLGSVKNTAFILSSIWSNLGSSHQGDGGGSDAQTSCESQGNYCVSSGSCSGDVLTDLDCSGFSSTCCSVPTEQLSCAELGGELCSSKQICSRGDFVSSGDALGITCCVRGGSCETPSPNSPNSLSECEEKGGICRSGSGLSGEDSVSYDCTFSGDICFISANNSDDNDSTSGSSTTWIWILLGLIVIVTLGIIFREKLRHLWLRIKSKFGKSGSDGPSRPNSGGPYYPPHYPSRTFRPSERRIIPSTPRPHSPPLAQRRSEKPSVSKELDDVLKKLKEMSK